MVQQWAARHKLEPGEILSVPQVWELSQRWYHNRLSPAYHGRTLDQVEDIFRVTGLLSPFWYMTGDD